MLKDFYNGVTLIIYCLYNIINSKFHIKKLVMINLGGKKMGAPVLNCEPICVIGKKLMLSGALMEAGLASFVQAESEKIEALVPLVADTPEITPAELIQVNRDATDALEAIRDIETIIFQKIQLGNALYNVGTGDDVCPCPNGNEE